VLPRFDIGHDLDLPVHVRPTEKEVTELRQTVRFDDTLQLNDGSGGEVEAERNTHRCRNDNTVLHDGESLKSVNVDAFLEFVDQLGSSAHSCSTKTSKN